MIGARELYDILGQNARMNRMASSVINSINKRHMKMEDMADQKAKRYGDSAILEYIQERVKVEASIRMHDEGIRHLRFSKEECPVTYDLIVAGNFSLDSKEY